MKCYVFILVWLTGTTLNLDSVFSIDEVMRGRSWFQIPPKVFTSGCCNVNISLNFWNQALSFGQRKALIHTYQPIQVEELITTFWTTNNFLDAKQIVQIARSVDGQIERSMDRYIDRLIGCQTVKSIDRQINRSIDQQIN